MSRRPRPPFPMMPELQASMRGLKQKELLPQQHIVDTGYVDAQLLHSSQQDFDIDLVGPTRPDVKWQAQENKGFAAGQFQIDWQKEQATCPRSVIRVSVGLQPSTIAIQRSSRSSSPSKIVKAVPVVACVRAPLALPVAPSRCVGSSSIKPYNRHERVLRPRSSKHSLPVALG